MRVDGERGKLDRGGGGGETNRLTLKGRRRRWERRSRWMRTEEGAKA